jgi:UDP-N-acetylglucosamine--N-acetylmuramyl-(pentapeptide) pyrophosphoryl-undecaprenol N-acetylglucosamine transferase
MKFIISGGGTGGHVFPAIAIANALRRQWPDAEILFVGAEGKMEMERVPKAGYPIEGLWISGFHRQLTLRNLLFPFKLIHSMWKAWRIVRKFKPDAVIGTGGYASGPTLRMASRGAVILQEQNSYAGVTNKLLAKKADKVCVAYDGMERYFPKDKVVLTGNPVRQDILTLDGKKAAAFQHFGLDANKKTIVLVGGSLGARTLNQSMAAATEQLAAQVGVQILWQCGKIYFEQFKDCATAQLPNVKLTMFIGRMDLAYSMADLVISRAGAIAISELCIVGKPVVLVPSPNVAEDHQTKNAMALVAKNAAIMVKDADAKETLIETAIKTLDDNSLSQQLMENIRQLGRPHAADHIADVILELVKNKQG